MINILQFQEFLLIWKVVAAACYYALVQILCKSIPPFTSCNGDRLIEASSWVTGCDAFMCCVVWNILTTVWVLRAGLTWCGIAKSFKSNLLTDKCANDLELFEIKPTFSVKGYKNFLLMVWACHHRSLSSPETAVCWQTSVSQLKLNTASGVVCSLSVWSGGLQTENLLLVSDTFFLLQ